MDEETLSTLGRLGLSALLGLLIGLQRERTNTPMAGVRTFPLITLLGSVAALLSERYGGWVLAAGFVALGAVLIVSNVAKLKRADAPPDPGTTTEIAILLMFGLGAYLAAGEPTLAVAVGGVVALLLHFKPELHGFVSKLGEEDLRAIMQFVLITCIVLPIVPNRTYGPYDVLNPHEVWLMVVLIVGLSLGGYLTYRFLGARVGILFGGVIGGTISSTATTVSYARRSSDAPQVAPSAAVVILIASAIVYIRVLIEISVVAPSFLRQAAAPISVMLGVSLLLAILAWLRRGSESSEMPPQKNPSELRSALLFAAIYAAVTLGLAAAQEWLGREGMFAVAAVSGLTDMDAITLSTARLVQDGRVEAGSGWRMVVLAGLSNLVFKAGLVATLGNRKLLWRILLFFGLHAAAGVAVLFFWPGDWS